MAASAPTRVRTSITHPIRLDCLPDRLLGTPGRLGLTFAPGKNGVGLAGEWRRDLRVDLARLRDAFAVDVLVNLLEDHEFSLLGIEHYLDEAARFEVLRLPIPDGGVPEDVEAVNALVHVILARLRAGKHVAVHCRGGLGRAGLVSACCLVAAGLAPEDAIREVRAARENAIENLVQEQFIRAFAVPR